MKKLLLLSVTIQICFICLVSSLFLVIISNGEKYIFFVIVSLLFCVLYVAWYIIFCRITRCYPKNELKDIINEKDLHNNLLIQVNEIYKGSFEIIVNNKSIFIELDDYIFGYDYIIAYLIRQIRYVYINKQRPIKYLFLLNYKLSIKNLNVILSIKKHNGKHRNVYLVKKSISKISFLQNIINKSKYYHYFYSNWSQSQYINKKICIINEKIYQNGDLKYYK